MNHSSKKAWQQYEAGKAYKRRIGLYETIRRNERFYRGDQWQNGEGADLPRPVFNVIRRIMDYLICSVASTNLTVRFTDDSLPYLDRPEERKALEEGLSLLSANAAWRWEKCGMDHRLMRVLTDAAITGDGVLYCYWDTSRKSPQLFHGDIVTEVIDNVNLFVSDVNRADIQSQDYVILSGRAPVSALRTEAAEAGVSPEDLEKIRADGDSLYQSGELSRFELEGDEEEKATYIVKFWREGGKVVFEKSTKECTIRRAKTDCRLYPVAYFNWIPTKNGFHGTSPITYLIPNQKFINRAYAMAMKHMTDTAFSKVIYDKSKIPEWSNEVGQAIAAVGGGNISDAVSVVGTGEMQSGYMELIESAVTMTKDMMGATESALGNMEANNTSAILALQETSRIPLEQVRSGYYRLVEDMAAIWADMMCAYYPAERLLPYRTAEGERAGSFDLSRLKSGFLSAHIDVAEITRYSAISVQNMLDKLLDGGYITPAAYVKRLPFGAICDRRGLIEELEQAGTEESNNITTKEESIHA